MASPGCQRLGWRLSMSSLRAVRAGFTRRTFLGALSAVPALAKDTPPIRTVEVFPINYPVTAYFKFLPKPERPSVFVKITREDGSFGIGRGLRRKARGAADHSGFEGFGYAVSVVFARI